MMDFLDPKMRRAHNIRLIVGYVLIAIALALATTILIYQANGFGVKQGKVIQNGLVFVSSAPSPATVYLNGDKYKDTTNTRIALQAGTYTMKLTRDGYRDWQRALTVEGGSVEHFDYPLLVPTTLSPVKVADYSALPPLATQSPDRRWLVVQQAQSTTGSLTFNLYDLKDPKKVAEQATVITMPAGLLTLAQDGPPSLELSEWSNDNDHVVLRHVVGEQSEYILVSRKSPETSVNLTRQLQLPAAATITLQDKKYDRYFMLDSASGALSSLSLNTITPIALLQGVLAYKTYGTNVILYTTATTGNGAAADKVNVRLYQDGKTETVRQLAKSPTYLLELSRYNDHWFVAAGATAENHVYVYRDPFQQLQKDASQPVVPVDVVKLTAPNYVAFSDNSQYIMVENGQDFAVYDAENDRSHIYRIDKPIDAPAVHATWMDGYRLRLVSGGEVIVFDYDGTNMQSLESALPAYLPFFDTGYQSMYTLAAPAASTAKTADQTPPAASFMATPLRTVKDQ